MVSPKPLSRRATLFRNGRNQAIRIPRDFEFQADEVILEKEGDRLIVQPVSRKPSLFEVLAAAIRAGLEERGLQIGLNDLLIAAHAQSLGLALATGNTEEFERIPGLLVENWLIV